MRLVTQNLLTCQVKACMDTAATPDGGFLSYPLKVVPDAGGLKQVASPFDEGVAKSILPRLDWAALRKTAAELGVAALPEEVPAGAESDAGFLRSVYALVFDIHLEEGNLLCPHCGRAYPVRKGVPNMLLRDDEM
ncbi:hypothetical protein FNF27_05621 [Cafeteria roenbergensis]|uniref:Trm112p-like protein n=1 Tax=Cafeteria roenbergensis TaxID=33653 RepID=A0A5A8E7Q8_CAFRO|nr:hypothetical protein FNF29_04835 [Cafeteria roenbergensis]KAA0164892.1 hypothetical protein FNF31_02215 [Cafeteria roenbergensis]KAA0167228.1 hypothetical protein FNF28_02877 [Cafeteria roenbergensis]KAA0172867.1 hypothetical protein FNF27_05621 [Cafeteria roenbergensis]|eukprot:KAA0151143.1 hypothetical protein FNF29_04835 [Cafeteria roenbergensis]